MLRKLRIEVEEATPDECVETLTKYEHALQAQEAKRYGAYFPVQSDDPPRRLDHTWDEQVDARDFFNSELGREVLEEVIEYDPSLPGYRGRRVVAFQRIDTRPGRHSFEFQVISPPTLGVQASGFHYLPGALE